MKPYKAFDEYGNLVQFLGKLPEGSETLELPHVIIVKLPDSILPDAFRGGGLNEIAEWWDRRERPMKKEPWEIAAYNILHEGLGDSIFKEEFPDAYANLLDYEEDIADTIKKTFSSVTDDAAFLQALRTTGVDSWEGYEEAQDYYNAMVNGS